MKWPAAGWIAALAAACSGDPDAGDAAAPGGDAGVDAAAAEDAGPQVDPPAPAALPESPRLAPCPAGWRQTGEGDETWCDPWPEGGRPQCPSGEVIFPGEPACAPIGARCPAEDPWAEGLPDDGTVLFVRAPAGEPVLGGAGSREAPFETIAEALAAAAPGGVVALSVGTFHEVVQLTAPVTVRGACAGGTVLDSPLPSGGGTVQVFGTDAVLRDVEVHGEGVWVRPAGAVRLEGVLVAGASPFGIAVNEGELTGARIVVRDTQGDGLGLGLHVQLGRAELEQVLIERARLMGLSVLSAPLVSVTDLAVLDTHEGTTGELGVGVSIGGGGIAELDRAVIESSRAAGAFLSDRASTLRATDVIFRDTIPDVASGEGGFGVSVLGAGTVELERALVERNETSGIGLADGGLAVLRDVLVRDTRSRRLDGIAGVGIGVTSWSELDAERVAVVRNRASGVTVGNEGTTARLADLIVTGTVAQDVDGEAGYGLSIGETASVVIERARFDDNTTAGIYAFSAGVLEAADLTIRDTREHSSGILGRGLTLQDAARAEVLRAVFQGNREATVFAAGEGTTVALEDVVVEDTLERACVDWEDGCAEAGAGAGIVSLLAASVDVRRFLVRGNAVCGVQIARDGLLALHDGEVSDNPIGANVQVEGFDFALLQDRVLFHDNGRNLDSSVLAVPDPSFSR